MPYNDRIGDFWSEIHRAQQREYRRSRTTQIASRVTPDIADRMARLTRAYPHLPPGVVRVIGATGIDPDHDIARTVAKLEAMRQASSPTGFGNPLGAIRRLGRQVTGMQQYISDLSDINTGRETVQTQHRIPRIQPPGTRSFMKPEEVTRPYPTCK